MKFYTRFYICDSVIYFISYKPIGLLTKVKSSKESWRFVATSSQWFFIDVRLSDEWDLLRDMANSGDKNMNKHLVSYKFLLKRA